MAAGYSFKMVIKLGFSRVCFVAHESNEHLFRMRTKQSRKLKKFYCFTQTKKALKTLEFSMLFFVIYAESKTAIMAKMQFSCRKRWLTSEKRSCIHRARIRQFVAKMQFSSRKRRLTSEKRSCLRRARIRPSMAKMQFSSRKRWLTSRKLSCLRRARIRSFVAKMQFPSRKRRLTSEKLSCLRRARIRRFVAKMQFSSRKRWLTSEKRSCLRRARIRRFMAKIYLLERTSASYFSTSLIQSVPTGTPSRSQYSSHTSPKGKVLNSSFMASILVKSDLVW